MEIPVAQAKKRESQKAQRSRKDQSSKANDSNKNTTKKVEKPVKEVKEEGSDDEGELCFICTESIVTFAVAACDHRTCHRCTLRLRALYETRNCAYCKAEQKVVIFTKDAEKPFDQYTDQDTPHVDKKLNIKFETQEMYKEAMHMLEYNCPQQKDCSESFKNWGELKQHVRKAHSLNICDLCSRYKHIFPYEHTLYTSAQLTKHHREGDKEFNKDDETGFSGHPECGFCKMRFFGDDELYIHCRDQHEQCFLCVRNGNRHEYYANYASLEGHFKSDHSMCLYPQCLEKKFIVFDSPIDLKAHEVEVHGESVSGLQRSMQTDARKLELNFQYDSYRNQQRGGGSGGSGGSGNNNRANSSSKGKKRDDSTRNSKTPATTVGSSSDSAPSSNEDNFPSINAATNESPARTARIIPGASIKKGRDKGKAKALQKPAGFGSLSDAPSTSSSADNINLVASSTEDTDTNNVTDSVVASHAIFLSKVADILETNEKVVQFRSLTGAYRKNNISGEDYVNQIVQLTNNSVENSGKIFKGVEKLLDIEEKKWELIRVWRNKHTAMASFPALDVRDKVPAPKASRVLVIKPKQINRVVGASSGSKKSTNVWDKVASAATVANTISRPTSAQSSARSSPQSSRPSSPSNTFRTPSKTPWSGSSSSTTTNNNISSSSVTVNEFPSLKPKTSAFPSLPSASPKHKVILNMRRTASGQQINNAWSGTISEDSTESEESSSLPATSKKKGRKQKVLFRVGL